MQLIDRRLPPAMRKEFDRSRDLVWKSEEWKEEAENKEGWALMLHLAGGTCLLHGALVSISTIVDSLMSASSAHYGISDIFVLICGNFLLGAGTTSSILADNAWKKWRAVRRVLWDIECKIPIDPPPLEPRDLRNHKMAWTGGIVLLSALLMGMAVLAVGWGHMDFELSFLY
ncbi:MAG: hypothetical protein JWO84_292 [Parcubacteria group bacterium]|nr:hypothetical protein [Parcubacteria group bacterium]